MQPERTNLRVGFVGAGLFLAPVIITAVLLWMFVTAADAHSWYSGTNDPLTGMGCCGGYDCAAIPENAVKIDKEHGGWRYLPTGELIPFYRVQQSHDFEFHRCEYTSSFTNTKGSFNKGDTRCFFVPGGTM